MSRPFRLFFLLVLVAMAIVASIQWEAVEVPDQPISRSPPLAEAPTPAAAMQQPAEPTTASTSSPSSSSLFAKKGSADNDHIEGLLKKALESCNADPRNNVKKYTSCIVLRDVVIAGDSFIYSAASNPEAPQNKAPFPSVGKTRHHMAPISLRPMKSEEEFAAFGKDAVQGAQVAYYQSPVVGAMWVNMWHTLADFFVMLFHTAAPLLNNGIPVHYITKTAKSSLGRGCDSLRSCEQMSLFDPFRRLFNDSYSFIGDGAMKGKVRHQYVLLGLNTRCSPIPTEDVGAPVCKENLRTMRDYLLTAYGLDAARAITQEEKQCPVVHVMSRQKDKYRRITPFNDMIVEMQDVMKKRGCPENNIRVVTLHGGISFGKQLEYINNHTLLVAGRGGGTALSPFIPIGGGYLSISGFDRWNPYRDLVPPWITMMHKEVSLVHHDDAQKPPQKFCTKGSCYIDPNRAGYKVDPQAIGTAFAEMLSLLQQ